MPITEAPRGPDEAAGSGLSRAAFANTSGGVTHRRPPPAEAGRLPSPRAEERATRANPV